MFFAVKVILTVINSFSSIHFNFLVFHTIPGILVLLVYLAFLVSFALHEPILNLSSDFCHLVAYLLPHALFLIVLKRPRFHVLLRFLIDGLRVGVILCF